MLPQELIRKKRDGDVLSAEDIGAFITGLTNGTVSEAQAASFAMAVFFQSMNRDEIVALTLAMRSSGRVTDWSATALNGPVVDKHSTGGVGDNVSLMLAPMLAACGAYVPMISGRALGHTGGTLDKFESIPGYMTQPDDALFRKVVKQVGAAIIGQTEDLAPADKKLYAIRDVTGTVESLPLITASILSKKLAAGLQALVLDVKSGNGAFMADARAARALAVSLTQVANGAGLKTTALLTDMNEPLCSAAGNAVEMQNAVDYLSGAARDARLHDVTLALGAELLVTSELCNDLQEAQTRLQKSLDSGTALERFAHMVAALGGPKDFTQNPEKYLRTAAVIKPVTAEASGFVSQIDTREIGLGVIALGGGRRFTSDKVDHSVGFTKLLPLGSKVEKGQPLAFVHAQSDDSAAAAMKALCVCYEIGEKRAGNKTPVLERIGTTS